MPLDRSRLQGVLLDRDGVLNQEPGPPLTPEAFKWIPGSAEALARLTAAGLWVAVVTNQAAIARGKLSLEGLQAITDQMNQDLAIVQGRVNGFYFCPHHPDWEDGARRSEPQPCGCRKPEPGLLEQAAAAAQLPPEAWVLIGDKTSDFEAARRFGCPSIGVRTGHAGHDQAFATEPLFWAEDLADAVSHLLSA